MEILAILTTIFGMLMGFAYFPQTYRIIKNKSAKDVSLVTYLIFTTGVALWLLYGLSIVNYPIIISNIVALIGSLSVLVVYFKYK